MLPIKGLQKMSLIDFSPYASCVVFIGGCNFRCPYCQNPLLVEEIDSRPTVSQDMVFEFLNNRKKWLDAVVITGGEPTLYPELLDFIESIKSMGYKVKLDTNGSRPKMLQKLLPLLDFVSMDIKAPLDKYDSAANADVDKESIRKSAELIKDKAKDYEFRTTVVRDFFMGDDAIDIGKWLNGSKKYVLQQFRRDMPLLDKSFNEVMPYTKEELESFRKILANYFEKVEIRGA